MALHVRLGAICEDTVLFLPLFDRQSLVTLLHEVQFQGCLIELTGPLPLALVQALIDRLEHILQDPSVLETFISSDLRLSETAVSKGQSPFQRIRDGMKKLLWDDLERSIIAFLEAIDRTFALTWLWQYETKRSVQYLYGSAATPSAFSFKDQTFFKKTVQERWQGWFRKWLDGKEAYVEQIIARTPHVATYLQQYRQSSSAYPMYREQLLQYPRMWRTDKDVSGFEGSWDDEAYERAERMVLQWLYLRGELTIVPSMRLVQTEDGFSFYCERCHTMVKQPEVWDCFDCGEKDIFCPVCQALGPSHGCKLVIMRAKNR